MIDWINEHEDYFQHDDVIDPQKVRLAQTKLKSHIAIKWKELQKDSSDNEEPKTNRWKDVISRIKAKFMSNDYELDFFRSYIIWTKEIIS